MEQYWTQKNKDNHTLKTIIDNYKPLHLFVRYKGSSGGQTIINKDLEDKIVTYDEDNHKIMRLYIDGVQTFSCGGGKDKGFSVAYRRKDDNDNLIILGGGLTDPYDKRYNEPYESFLRQVYNNVLFELTVKGRIDIKKKNNFIIGGIPYYEVKNK